MESAANLTGRVSETEQRLAPRCRNVPAEIECPCGNLGRRFRPLVLGVYRQLVKSWIVAHMGLVDRPDSSL